jgi:hypothetical protein
MRCERLRYEAEGREVALPLHPDLTVFGGLGPAAARVLADDLAAALLAPRPGCKAHLVDETGRPVGSLGDLVDVPPSRAVLERLVHVGPDDDDVAARRAGVLAIAAGDPGEIAARARAASVARAELAALHAALDTATADTVSAAELGSQHGASEDARTRADRRRAGGIALAFALSAGGLAAAMAGSSLVALPLLLVSAAVLGLALWVHRRALAADEAERAARAALGAETSLGVQLKRVNLMLQATRERRELVQAEARHREAVRVWSAVAGPIDPAALDDLADELAMLRGLPAGRSRTAAGVVALIGRIEAARVDDEPLPVVLDHALDDLPDEAAIGLLEVLLRRRRVGQVVLVTTKSAVLEWARTTAGGSARVVATPMESLAS